VASCRGEADRAGTARHPPGHRERQESRGPAGVAEGGRVRYSYQDQGIQTFSYRLVPHAAGWERSGIVRLATELNQPATALLESFHEGRLPRSDSYLEIDAPSVVMSALKVAEDGGALVLRCYETDRVATRARIRMPRWER